MEDNCEARGATLELPPDQVHALQDTNLPCSDPWGELGADHTMRTEQHKGPRSPHVASLNKAVSTVDILLDKIWKTNRLEQWDYLLECQVIEDLSTTVEW